MKTFKNEIVAISILAVFSLLTAACNSSDEIMEKVDSNIFCEDSIPHHATMQLNSSITPFDATRATTTTWKQDDMIYLQFTVGASVVNGYATFDSKIQQWDVKYYGTLTTGIETKCEAYYFENAKSHSPFSVMLDDHSIIYSDKSASYLFEDGVVKVTAHLKPMTGRIRFERDKNSSGSLCFMGFGYYTSYNAGNNSFATACWDRHHSIMSYDYFGTPIYYYGFFVDESDKYICFDDFVNYVSYTCTLGEQALAVGRSGCLTVPGIYSINKGWTLVPSFKDFTVSDVSFRMIRIVDNIMGHFYVGETEVTQELWTAIMGKNPSTFKGPNMPVETISYSDYEDFILRLNAKTGEKFYIPESNDWFIAAEGAGFSNRYEYSGSNTLDDVAWHKGNSNGTTHPVKGKMPNEIGLYDMSGNVSEIVRMTPSNRELFFRYGGCWNNDKSDCSLRRKGIIEDGSAVVIVPYFPYFNGADKFTGIRLFLKD